MVHRLSVQNLQSTYLDLGAGQAESAIDITSLPRHTMDIIQEWQSPHRAYKISRYGFENRELRPSELMLDFHRKKIPLPPDSKARLENELYMLRFLRQNTEVPIPDPVRFSDGDGIGIVSTSRMDIDKVALSDYEEEDRDAVVKKVENHLVTKIIPTLRQNTSLRWVA